MNSLIQSYYQKKENIVRQSLSTLFPETCSEEWLHQITGRKELAWDTKTLDTFLLQPINTQIKNKPYFQYALGCLLLLESSNKSVQEHLPAIAISEGFECSFQLFKSVRNHQKEKASKSGLEIDAAVNANVAVAMLGLPVYPILLNLIKLDDSTKLWILKNITQSISRVFYANAIRQNNKQNKTYFKNERPFEQYAYYLNSPKLKFNLDYWIAVNNYINNESITNRCNQIIKLFTITNQIISDQQSYTSWSNSTLNQYPISFEPNSFIHTYLATKVKRYSIECMPIEFIDSYKKNSTENYIQNKIEKNIIEINQLLEGLPLHHDYIQLIKSYTLDLLLKA